VPSLAAAVIEPARSVAPVVLALTNAAPIAAHATAKTGTQYLADQIDLVLKVVTEVMVEFLLLTVQCSAFQA
jgi:hypothetical protein